MCRAAFTLFLTVAGLLQAAIPPAENLLPSDTLAFFTVPDFAAARVAGQSSTRCRFWDDPAMRPFREKFMTKWNDQLVAPLQRDLGVQIADFTDLPQGQFTLAVTANGWNGHDDIPPGLLLLLDAKGESGALKTNLALIERKCTEAGRALRTEQIHGLPFTVVPLSSNDLGGLFQKKSPNPEPDQKPAKPREIYFTQVDSLLVVGNSLKVVEPVAAHLTGGSAPAVADNAVFAGDKLSQFRENPVYYAWFNGKRYFDLFAPASADNDNADTLSLLAALTSPQKMLALLTSPKGLAALGLTGLKSASIALRETRDGSTLTVHLNVPEAGRAGLLKILAIAPKDASAPPFVPADAVNFTRLRLDGRQTWAETQKMLAGLLPDGQAGLNAVFGLANSVGQQKNPGFDLRNDLFGNLSDDIISYQKPVLGNSVADLLNPPTLILIAVVNSDAVINALKTVAGMFYPPDDPAEPREFLGHKIHAIPVGPKPASLTGRAPRPTLYITACGGYLALGSDSAMVEDYLRSFDGKVKPLRDAVGLADAARQVGGLGNGTFGYVNDRENMRETFAAVRMDPRGIGRLGSLYGDFFNGPGKAFRDWMDFSLLPDYNQVARYFNLSVNSQSTTAEGVTFKYFTPRPPQMK